MKMEIFCNFWYAEMIRLYENTGKRITIRMYTPNEKVVYVRYEATETGTNELNIEYDGYYGRFTTVTTLFDPCILDTIDLDTSVIWHVEIVKSFGHHRILANYEPDSETAYFFDRYSIRY